MLAAILNGIYTNRQASKHPAEGFKTHAMTFEWFALQGIPSIALNLPIAGYLVTLLYAGLTAAVLVRDRKHWSELSLRQWGLLIALLIVAPFLAGLLGLRVQPGAGGWIEQLLSSSHLSLTPLGLLPVTIAALWLGRTPALLVGLFTGLAWALFDTGRPTQPFEVALLAVAMSTFLNQQYRGMIGHWLRQPLVAAAAAALGVGWPLALIGIFVVNSGTLLASLEQTLSAVIPVLVANLGGALIAGALLQAIIARWPHIHPVRDKDLRTPPWGLHLRWRVLYASAPLIVFAIVILIGAVAWTSYHVATRLVVDQMARDAANAGNQVPFFIQVGRSLIRNLSQDRRLLSAESETRQGALSEGLRAVPFFEQLIYFDTNQRPANAYPQAELEALDISPEEASRVLFALEGGIPAEVVTIYTQEADEAVVMSFIAPVIQPGNQRPVGALLGRTVLATNPILAPVVEILRAGFVGAGEGLIIDDQNRILLYPAHPELQQQSFMLGTASEIVSDLATGQAFRQRQPDGTRRLIYILPITGRSDWSVVVIVPNQVALALSVQIAFPTLLLLVALIALGLVMVIQVIQRVTVPIESLLDAAVQIAEGQFDLPLSITSEDEVGRLGRAFEQMQLKLKKRLGEQERLLSVSRSVSSSLELFRAMPPILSAALDVTDAAGVRVVLQGAPNRPVQTYAAGGAASVMAVLDAQLLSLVEQQGTVVISQLWRAAGSLDITAVLPRIQALVALPLRSDTSFHGILWLAYESEHVFEQTEMNFLSTLAGQAAIAVANARLFAEAEEGRRQLEAVLESTADGMIVVDDKGRVVLMNPAAEKHFNIRIEQAKGRDASQVVGVPELAHLLANLTEPVSVIELPGHRGTTLLANTSTIVSHNGTIAGRVAVLRDITALKELDNIKTVFLRMVSHDLRSPLTYMRGYLSMLPISGDLNERQREALTKINSGIEHISDMTERLTHLSRLQFGDEAELEFSLVDVEEMVREVYLEYADLAQQKNITLMVEAEQGLPFLMADAMLYRQAIANLVNNALKYTPDGGQVILRAVKDGEHQITVSVKDNGIGIREEDQSRLFEAFYRVPQRVGEPPRPRGTGLGLALVKAIAEAHGGGVSVQSEFGAGSTFSITLPIREPEDM
jgi:PAS domain S-box-containing protein